MPAERVTFSFQDGTFAIAEVRRNSRSKRLRLRIDANLSLTLTAPATMDFAQIQRLSPQFLPWLEKTWKKHTGSIKDQQLLPEKIYVPLLNRNYHVCISTNIADFKPVSFDNENCLFLQNGINRIVVAAKDNSLFLFGHTQMEKLCVLALQEFFRFQANNHLIPYIHKLGQTAHYEDFDVAIRNQKGRWGSCAKKLQGGSAKINLNWRSLLLPVDLLEHLCWHELVHMLYMNHSTNFHKELAKHSPHSLEKEKLLNVAWQNLPMWTHFRE